ncbi:MAG TPA: hypothetical protein VE225_06425, partial [Rubrobacteraceae bacterium]|nr:hypothetical protein [Rubrobacteraceae bacterium]
GRQTKVSWGTRRDTGGAGFAVLLFSVLALGVLVGCGGYGGEGNGGGGDGNALATGELPGGGTTDGGTMADRGVARSVGEPTKAGGGGSDTVVIRVSGTQGTAYSGNFGTSEDVRNVVDTVGAGPIDYEIQVGQGAGTLNATFNKTKPGSGNLRVEVVVGGETVTQSETSAELGSAIVNYVPQGSLPEETKLSRVGGR